MRYIIIIFICISQIAICELKAQTVNQPGLRDYQNSAHELPDSILYIMSTDTSGSREGLGKWRRADSLVNSLGDHDFYGLNTNRPPFIGEDSIETALDTMYVLFKGLDGGLATKIEMLKNGVLRFDKTGLYNTPSYLMSINPFQSGVNVGRMGLIGYASDNTYGSKKNQVMAFGLNPLDFDDTSTGLYFSLEDYYRPTSGPAYGEIHLVFNDSSDVDHRIWTWFLNRLDPTAWTATYYVDQLAIRDPRALTSDSTYFKIEQVDGNQSQLVLMGANQSVSGGSRGVGQLVHSTNNTFEIYPYGSMPSSSEFYTRQFNVTNVNRLRIENDFGTTNGSSGLATSIIGREASYGGVVGVGSGWGWDLISGALVIDSSEVASQFDLTTDPTWYEVGTTRRPDANTDDIFKSSGKVGIGEASPSNRLEVVAASASDDESILRLSGGSSGFSGANESDQEHSIIFDGCGFNGSAISQQDGAMIAMKKEGSWNEAANGVAGIKSALVFKTQNGTIASPSLTEKMRLGSTGQLTLNEYTTSNFNGGTASDSVLVVTSAGVVKKRNAASFGGGSSTTDLTIGGAGPTYTIESSTGTDVTVANLYGLTLSESPANTLNFQVDTTKLATQYDISGFGTMSNWLLAAASTAGTETVTNGETVTFQETAGMDATRSTNTVTYSLDLDELTTDAAWEGDEYLAGSDGAATNEKFEISTILNTIEEGNVSTQTDNTNLDFQSMFDVAADGAGEVNVSFDSGEATTVTTAQSDDYMLMHDSGTGGTEKMLWSDFVIDLISFEEDNVNEGTGNTIDLGTGLDGSYASAEYDISLDFNEFTTDAAAEGDEYVIVYDPSSVIQEKILIPTFLADVNGMWSASNDNTNIANSTFEVGVPGYLDFRDGSEHDLYIDAANDRIGMGTNSPNYGLHVKNDAGAAIEANASGVNEVLKIEGTADGGGANNAESSILFNYTDADYSAGAEQQGLDMTLYKESDANQWSTFKMTMKEATDADAIVLEKNADFTGNTTESHVAFNGGIAYTQNYDGSTAGADLNLDRSYYTINITGGNLTDTIKLPEVAYTTDNWDASLTSTQCQVGQEYVISNLRSGVNLVISAYNPAGTSDDLIGTRTAPGGAAGSAISIAPGKSVIVKCYQLSGGIGYWNYWLSN